MNARTLFAVLFFCALTCAVCRAETASWYGEDHRGRITANGERFNPDDFTAASWYFPFGAHLLVSSGTRSVIVRVNDRGPAKRLHRAIDLSRAAFASLANTRKGLIPVRIERID